MSTDSTANSDTVTVTIDLDAPLPERYLGASGDGPEYGPVSLRDSIIVAAARQVAGRIEKETKATVEARIREAIDELVDERLPQMVWQALTEPLTITNEWGREEKTKALRDLVVERVQQQIKPSRDYSVNSTVFDTVVRKHIDRTLTTELRDAVAEAKATLVAQVRDATAEHLSKAIVAGVTSR